MPLFEAIWPEISSILISAHSAGEALLYVKQFFGADAIYQLDELIEIKSTSFLLVRRCGRISTDVSSLSYNLCPDSAERVFIVEKRGHGLSSSRSAERSVIVVHQLNELPSLVLWHYDMISEEDCLNGDLVCELWEQLAGLFRITEVDTQRPGILMSYEYCNCPPQLANAEPAFHQYSHEIE